MNLNASDLRPFIPAQDFALSRRFYQALGWREGWADDTMVLLELGGLPLLPAGLPRQRLGRQLHAAHLGGRRTGLAHPCGAGAGQR